MIYSENAEYYSGIEDAIARHDDDRTSTEVTPPATVEHTEVVRVDPKRLAAAGLSPLTLEMLGIKQ